MTIDRSRLEKFLGLLGSEHDGERANAARFVHRMAQEHKLTIVELMRQIFGGSAGYTREPPPRQSWADDMAETVRRQQREAREARERQEAAAARERARRASFFDEEPPWDTDREEEVRRDAEAAKRRQEEFERKRRNKQTFYRRERAQANAKRRNQGEPLI